MLAFSTQRSNKLISLRRFWQNMFVGLIFEVLLYYKWTRLISWTSLSLRGFICFSGDREKQTIFAFFLFESPQFADFRKAVGYINYVPCVGQLQDFTSLVIYFPKIRGHFQIIVIEVKQYKIRVINKRKMRRQWLGI